MISSNIFQFYKIQNITILNFTTPDDNTALHLAATNSHPEVLHILLENGAQVQEKNSKDWTALDCAASSGALACAELLLQYDAPVDPMDKAHTTPLHLAAQFGHPQLARLLLEHGADVTLEDIYGYNALEIAVKNSRRAVAKVIIDSEKWRLAMRTNNVEEDSLGTPIPDTPMRMLIRTFPILAEEVFDKCVFTKKSTRKGKKGEAPADENTEVKKTNRLKMDYEFIDDTFNLEPVSTKDQLRFQYCPVDEKNDLTQYSKPYNSNGKVRMDNHPLMIMAKKRQKVNFPLVVGVCLRFFMAWWMMMDILC